MPAASATTWRRLVDGAPTFVTLTPDGSLAVLSGAPWAGGVPTGRTLPAGSAFLAPVTPTKIIGIGRNYRKHAEELKNEVPEEPLMFFKPPSSLLDPGGTVLLPPDLSTLPRSRFLIHPAKKLNDAGIEIGFVIGDSPAAVRMLFFRLMELVRTGLPADIALRGVTLVPAKVLGVEAKKGSLEAGKDADLLVFRGDPLSPTSELQSVWLRGREVGKQP